MPLLQEHFITLLAFVFPDADMDSKMPVQVARSWECFTAYLAFVLLDNWFLGLLLDVGCPVEFGFAGQRVSGRPVSCEVLGIVASQATLLAVVFLCDGVSLHVVCQPFRVGERFPTLPTAMFLTGVAYG